jgi:hypothetical protein
MLYVLERSGTSSSLSVEFCTGSSPGGVSSDCPHFLPVVNCDEDRLEMTLVLGIPDDFRFEDVRVKTVDNDVWISGSRSPPVRGPSPPLDSVFEFPAVAAGAGKHTQSFRVVVPLPEGTDNRSVMAALTPRNQIIVKARLGTTSRRYTF